VIIISQALKGVSSLVRITKCNARPPADVAPAVLLLIAWSHGVPDGCIRRCFHCGIIFCEQLHRTRTEDRIYTALLHGKE